jgi:glycerol-3-phosphate O-acyltransferase
MLASIVHFCRRHGPVVLAAALAQALMLSAPATADGLADFHAAVERALDQYHFAIDTLESSSQERTAAEVLRLREAWQAVAERFGAQRPAVFADDDDYGGMFLQIDVRLVGVLLVIDLGNRDAARSALAPIEETLTRLAARSAPPR